MKTEIEINKDISDITNKIQKNFPELAKYIIEMSIKITNNDSREISTKNLIEYYDSLQQLMTHYAITHKIKQ